MKVERDDVSFLATVRFLNLPVSPVDDLDSIATPDITNCETYITKGTVVTVTNFLNGSDGQTLSILGDGATTIKNNAHISTNTAADKLLASNKVYRFTYFSTLNKWFEDA